MLLFSRMFAELFGEPEPTVGTVTEVIDLSTFSGGPYVTLETIDGHPLSSFAFIYGYFEAANTAAGGNFVTQLSVDGSTWRNGATEYLNCFSNDATATNGYDTTLKIANGGEPWITPFVICDIGVAAPTFIRARELTTVGTTQGFNIGRSNSAVVDTAIRFFEDGLSNWIDGTLHLMGVLTDEATVQTVDFTASPATSHVFEIPVGHTLGNINFVNGLTAVNASLGIRVGTGDVFTEDYNGSFYTRNASSTFTLAEMPMTYSADNDQEAMITLWGLRTPAPVTGFGKDMAPGTYGGMWTTVTQSTSVEYDQILVKHNKAGNFTAGVCYLVTYKAVAEVETVDFGAGAAASHDFTDLDTYPIVSFVAPTLTLASAGEVLCRVSTDGAAFDDGAANYRVQVMSHNMDEAIDRSYMQISPGSYSTQGFTSILAGFGQDHKLTMMDAFIIKRNGGTSAKQAGGGRVTAQVNTALRIYNSAAANFTAGEIYRIGFRFAPLTYRYLRVIFSTSHAGRNASPYPGAIKLAQMGFRATEGGTDLTGTWTASYTQGGSNGPEKLADGDPISYWYSGDNSNYSSGIEMGHDVMLDLGEGNESGCAELHMQAVAASVHTSARYMAPQVFTVLGSNNGTSWNVLWFQPSEGYWSSGEARVFTPATGVSAMQIIRFYQVSSTWSGALACAEMEFRVTAAGSKTDGVPITRKAIAGTSNEPDKINDSNSSSFTTNGGGWSTEYIGMVIPNDVLFEEMLYEVRPDSYREDPKDARVERSLDGGQSFTTLKSFPTIPAWSAGESRLFDIT